MLTHGSLSTKFPRIVCDLNRDVAALRWPPIAAEECDLQGRVPDRDFGEGTSSPSAHARGYRVKNYVVVWFLNLSHGKLSTLGIRAAPLFLSKGSESIMSKTEKAIRGYTKMAPLRDSKWDPGGCTWHGEHRIRL